MGVVEPRDTAIAYIITGTLIIVGNKLVILAVMLRRHLRKRKELLIIASMSIGNFVYGLAYFSIGARRLIINAHPVNRTFDAFDCSTEGFLYLFWYGGQTMAIMDAVVSIDRFIAVAKPLYYFKLTRTYVWKITAIVYLGYGSVILAIGFGSSKAEAQKTGPIWPAACLAPFAVPYELYKLDVFLQVALVTTASFMYLGVLVLLKKRRRKQSKAPGSNQSYLEKAQKRQDQVTKILGFVVASSLLLFSIPYSVYVLGITFNLPIPITGDLGFISWVLGGVNAAVNVVIYIITHQDIRRSIVGLFRGQCIAAKVGPETSSWTARQNPETANQP